MGSFASKELTPAEQMKQYKRELDRAIRELDRERTKLERQSDKIGDDIKKAAKANQMAVVKIMAKDYVRAKKNIAKFMKLRTWLQGVSIHLQTMKSVDAMATSLRNATKAMVRMNARLQLPQLTAILRTFGIESAKMEDTSEMIGDSLDDIFGASDEEEEEDELVRSVMAELSLTTVGALPSAPKDGLATAAPTAAPAARVAAPMGAGAGAGVAPKPPTSGPAAGAGGPSTKPPGGDGGGSGGTAAPPPSAGAPSDFSSRLAKLRGGDDDEKPSAPP